MTSTHFTMVGKENVTRFDRVRGESVTHFARLAGGGGDQGELTSTLCQRPSFSLPGWGKRRSADTVGQWIL